MMCVVLEEGKDWADKQHSKEPGEMSEYNDGPCPDNLRALANDPTFPRGGFWNTRLLAAADAWEADRLAGHEWRIEGEELRQRLDAAETLVRQYDGQAEKHLAEIAALAAGERKKMPTPKPDAPKPQTIVTGWPYDKDNNGKGAGVIRLRFPKWVFYACVSGSWLVILASNAWRAANYPDYHVPIVGFACAALTAFFFTAAAAVDAYTELKEEEQSDRDKAR